ncbi:ABC transporter substrate-binding protein, partial [Acinetobacter baumannii]
STSRNYGPVQQQGFGHDLDKARRLLREGGYAGRPVVITTNSQFGLMKDTAILLQAMLQAVGIKAEVETIEFGAQLDRYFKGRYQLMVWNVTPY